MESRKLIICYIFTCVIMIHRIDSIASHERWMALGDEIKEEDNRFGEMDIENYDVTLPVSSMTEIYYNTKNGRRINSIIATASMMKGFVSLEDGGLDEDHVRIRYATENGSQDELYVSIQSYKRKILILNDNSARIDKVAVVINDIRNWTDTIVKQAIENDAKLRSNQ